MRNSGKRTGKGVAQLYIAPHDWRASGWEAPKRLGAFAKAGLKPGERKRIELTVDPRLLATYEAAGNNWHIKAGTYRLMLGEASDGEMAVADVTLPDSVWSASRTSEP
jgi:beta-glucosidase